MDECDSSPCNNGGTCVDAINGYVCLCSQGWEGAECQDRRDLCAPDQQACHAMADCTNTFPGAVQCNCLPGYMGDALVTGSGCVDIDEWCVARHFVLYSTAPTHSSFCLRACSNGTHWQWYVNKNTGHRIDQMNHRFALSFDAGQVDFSVNSKLRIEVYASIEVKLLVSLQDSHECDATQPFTFSGCHTLPAVVTLREIATENVADDHDGPWTVRANETTVLELDFGGFIAFEPETDPPRELAVLSDISRINFFADYQQTGYVGDLTFASIDQNGPGFSLNLLPGMSRTQSQWRDGNDVVDTPDLVAIGGISPCAAHACVDSTTNSSIAIDAFECVCEPGWEGDNCTTDVNECLSQPCQHSGTCSDSTDCVDRGDCAVGINEFLCMCSDDWTGDTCQDNVACSAEPYPCNTHGERTGDCSPTTGLDALFECACFAGWNGTTCNEDVNECASNPCGNRGNCSDQLVDNVPPDSFNCSCFDGWEGDRCQLDTAECATGPCLHDGDCIDSTDWVFSPDLGVHQRGVDDTAPSVVEQCASVNISKALTCVGNASLVAANTPRCDEHAPGYCPAGCATVEEACVGVAFDCSITCAIDDSAEGSDRCPAGCDWQQAACRGTAEEVPEHTPVCGYVAGICPEGCTEEYSSATACEALPFCEFVDETESLTAECRAKTVLSCRGTAAATGCSGDPADETSSCELDSATGICPAGCTATVPECILDPDTGECPAGCDWNVPVGDYDCICTAGREGSNCEIDIDECVSNPCENATSNTNACIDSGNNGVFSNSSVDENAYACLCNSGWHGEHCELDFDECMSSPCQNGGACYDSNSTDSEHSAVPADSYVCVCVDGVNGTNCENDIDECLEDIELACVHGSCSDSNTDPQINFTDLACACFDGYRNATCSDGPYGAVASIAIDSPFAFFNSSNGTFASIVGSLAVAVNVSADAFQLITAQPYAQNQSMVLMVLRLFSGDEDSGIPFALDIAQQFGADVTTVDGIQIYHLSSTEVLEGVLVDCTNPNCSSHGECISRIRRTISSNEFVDVGVGTCDCEPGWTDATCDMDYDECVSMPCEHGSECTDSNDDPVNGTYVAVDAFRCDCVPGYSGVHCEHDVDECLSEPCQHNGTCSDSTTDDLVPSDDFSCSCTSGWSGHECQLDTNECDSSPCQNGGSCSESNSTIADDLHIAIDEYQCECRNGSLGFNCAIDVDECASIPCVDGQGTCLDSNTTMNIIRMTNSCATANLSSAHIDDDRRACAAAGSCRYVGATVAQTV